MKGSLFCTAVVLTAGLSATAFAESGGIWGPTVLVSQPDFVHRSLFVVPRATIDPAGNALAVWAQSLVPGSPLQFELVSRRFSPDTGWQDAQSLGPLGGSILEPIGHNDSGRAAVPYFDILTRRATLRDYSPLSGWSAGPVQLSDLPENSGANVQVAVDDAGDMLAIWDSFLQDGILIRHQIFARYFDSQVGWGPIEMIVNLPYTGGADRPALAMNQGGDAIAVWRSDNPSLGEISLYGRFFRPKTGWSDMGLISATNHAVGSGEHPIAIDQAGNVQVIYDDAQDQRLYFQRYERRVGWTAPLVLDDDAATYANPRQLTSNRSGESLIVWHGEAPDPATGDTASFLFYRQFQPSCSRLTADQALLNLGSGEVKDLSVAITNTGEALLAFGHVTDANALSVEALKYSPRRDVWSDHQVLDTQQLTDHSLFHLSLATNQNRSAVAVWGVKDLPGHTGRVWASVFH